MTLAISLIMTCYNMLDTLSTQPLPQNKYFDFKKQLQKKTNF